MKRLTIKIERRSLHIAETQTRGESVTVNRMRVFPLPENLEGESAERAPKALAAFVAQAIKRGRMTAYPAVLLLGASLAPGCEYRLAGESARAERERARDEAEGLLRGSASDCILVTDRYGRRAGDDAAGSRAGAVFAVRDAFLREFLKRLRRARIPCARATPALAAYSEVARGLLLASRGAETESDGARSVLAIDAEEDGARLVLFRDAEPLHRREAAFMGGDGDAFLDFLETEINRMRLSAAGDETNEPAAEIILLSGSRAASPETAARVGERTGIPCRPFGEFQRKYRPVLRPGGELRERPGLFSCVVAVSVHPARIRRKIDFLYGGFGKLRERRVSVAVCAALTLVALAFASFFPAAGFYLQRRGAADKAIIEGSEYDEARDRLAVQRQLTAQIQSHQAEEEYLQTLHLKYAEILRKLDRELIGSGTVRTVSCDKEKNRMRVTFATRDADGFLAAKESLNDAGELRVAEPVTMEMQENGEWICDVVVSWKTPKTE